MITCSVWNSIQGKRNLLQCVRGGGKNISYWEVFQGTNVISWLIRRQEASWAGDQTVSASQLLCSWQHTVGVRNLRHWSGYLHPARQQSWPAAWHLLPTQRWSPVSRGDLEFFLVWSTYPSPRAWARRYRLKGALRLFPSLLERGTDEIVPNVLVYKNITYFPSVLNFMADLKKKKKSKACSRT